MKKKALITGKNGQLAQEFIKIFSKDAEYTFFAFSHKELDIAKLSQVIERVNEIKPDIIINCAAYNQVDEAEKNYKEAIRVNAIGPKNLAYVANKYNILLVHYSTDYVFDGEKKGALYTEEDEPNPINRYGESKYLGELYIKEETDNYLIFRVSWLYGNGKQNFIYKLLQWAKQKEYLQVASDEVSVPTSVDTVVNVTLEAIRRNLRGLHHLTNSGYASRYEWAKEILKVYKIDKLIYPVSMDIFNLPAKRPRFSAMSNKNLRSKLKLKIKNWKEKLEIE